jgi:hypothetical protein
MKHHFPTHGYDGYTRPLFVFHCAAVALCEQTEGGGGRRRRWRLHGKRARHRRVGAASVERKRQCWRGAPQRLPLAPLVWRESVLARLPGVERLQPRAVRSFFIG